MADKNDIYLNYKGIDYEVVFTLNVMEQIQDEYGTIEKWGDLTEGTIKGKKKPDAEPNAKAVIFGLTCMINEGIDIYNEDHEGEADFKPRKYLTKKQVGRLLTDVGITEATSKLNKAVIDSTKSNEKN